jgi:hypothetical protein
MLQIVTFVNRLIRTFALFTDITKQGMIQLILSRKRGGMYLVSATPTKLLIEFLSNGIPSCTSAGSVLQLCKVSQNSNMSFRRSCAYKVHNPPFRESIS